MSDLFKGVVILTIVLALTGFASVASAQQPAVSVPGQGPMPSSRQVDASVATRLKTVMVPLLQHMNRPIPLDQVQVGLTDDHHVNAANAGGGHFYVTIGLLEKANDDQLRAVMAHEIAHADLGHVAKAQRLGAGLTIGMVLLDQIIPGTRKLTPIAGQLIQSSYGRKEEYEADAHGVEILQRAGYDGRSLMADTLTWLTKVEGTGGGGFFATHPATGDRIAAVRRLPGRPTR
jgi:predicted Zn-dependent protease